MKRLLILRHAKSSWADSDLSDFDRPLNERGMKAAPFMGSLIAQRGLLPDAIVSSPAKRAKQTATLFRDNSGADLTLTFDDRIYEASPNTLRKVVSETTDELASIMIVGHNPGIEGFIRHLTGNTESMPTAAIAVIDLEIDSWTDIANESGILVTLIKPKEEMSSVDGASA